MLCACFSNLLKTCQTALYSDEREKAARLTERDRYNATFYHRPGRDTALFRYLHAILIEMVHALRDPFNMQTTW